MAELQRKLDELQVASDRQKAESDAKLAEMERRYNIAVKTGSKTGVQAGPAQPENPVMDYVNRRYSKAGA